MIEIEKLSKNGIRISREFKRIVKIKGRKLFVSDPDVFTLSTR